jgi:Cft2 family RNA processing exonuclease
MVKFVQNLHEHRKSELRPDVLVHSAQLNKNRKVLPSYISDETVLRMVSSRIDKMLKNRKVKKNWSEEDLKILVWTVSKYADLHCFTDLEKDFTLEDWSNLAQLIPGVTPSSCMFKWLSIRKVNLSVQYWEGY